MKLSRDEVHIWLNNGEATQLELAANEPVIAPESREV